jgi:uncharacterized protein
MGLEHAENLNAEQAVATVEGAPELEFGVRPSFYNVIIPLRDGRALAYNTAARSFAVWSRDDVALCQRAERESVPLSTTGVQDMLSGGYMVVDGTDELAMLEARYNATRYHQGAMTLTIMPTAACNFGCDYCFQGANKPSAKMSQQVQDAIVSFVERSAPSLHNLHVAWYGGEPLIGADIMRKLSDRFLDICAQRKIVYSASCVTNGWFLTEELVKELLERKLTTYQVTLDGGQVDHDGRRYLLGRQGTFARIIQNLRAVVDQVGVQFNIRVNIDSRNRDGIRALIDSLAAAGLAGRRNLGLYYAPVEAMTEGCHGCSDVTMSKSEYGQLEAELYRYAVEKGLTGYPTPPRFLGLCVATKPKGMVITPTGDIHKCWDTVSWPSMKVGTIFETEKLWTDPRWLKWSGWTPFKHETCRSCKILPSCSGMCAYKSVHSDKTRGEVAELPCPSWKYNIKERLFIHAEKRGLVKRDDWIDRDAGTQLLHENAKERWASIFESYAKEEKGKARAARPLPLVR